MRVFVLCTGRCGSTTFTYASRHATNFTAGHESRARFVGAERLNYPANHIEVDNRLAWFLGRLDEAFGDEAHYVHLIRSPHEVAASYSGRMLGRKNLARAYRDALLEGTEARDLETCLDMVDTITRNIRLFLRDKTRTTDVRTETAKADFTRFWHAIGAEGDLLAALAEWDRRYNDSERSMGRIPSPARPEQLADVVSKSRLLPG